MFYKKEQDQLLSGAWVLGAYQAYHLTEETKDQYTYPVDGWIYAENLDAAIAYFANVGKSTITLRQCKLALLNAGKLPDVLTYINAMPEPQRTAALIEFNDTKDVERNSVLLNTVAAAIGLTPEQTDSLFAAAKFL
ncbi:hypothetical protein [Zoogloea sp.]|uniref:hypothetical protein n=1 Tax=Zoogloea sp. TaxID=49181 RepID=UPI0014161AB7|nr:MAG: hypothetical protein F9K15_02470 [Zoogloea sp.]